MASGALKFGKHIKELRLHLCQTSAPSKGIRDFIENHYVSLKKANPQFPMLIRECSGIQPKAWARYEFGRETSVDLSGFNSGQVLKALEQLSQETIAK